MAVAALGDVNGDGRRDMIIGAPGAGAPLQRRRGRRVRRVHPGGAAPIDLGDLGAGGYAIRGGLDDANAGTAVASAGDWNRDGRGDALVLRADFDDSTDGKQAPRLDLLLGREPPPIACRPARRRSSSSSSRRCPRCSAAAASKPASPWPRRRRSTTSTWSSRFPTKARNSRSPPPGCHCLAAGHVAPQADGSSTCSPRAFQSPHPPAGHDLHLALHDRGPRVLGDDRELTPQVSTVERHPRGAEALDERAAHRRRGREDAEPLRQRRSSARQSALSPIITRGRRVARVALRGDRRAAAGAVDLHLEVAARARLLARALARVRAARGRAPCAWAEREAAGERAEAGGEGDGR